jgi:hypothetical protein
MRPIGPLCTYGEAASIPAVRRAAMESPGSTQKAVTPIRCVILVILTKHDLVRECPRRARLHRAGKFISVNALEGAIPVNVDFLEGREAAKGFRFRYELG